MDMVQAAISFVALQSVMLCSIVLRIIEFDILFAAARLLPGKTQG